jgi:hypothetical protein
MLSFSISTHIERPLFTKDDVQVAIDGLYSGRGAGMERE